MLTIQRKITRPVKMSAIQRIVQLVLVLIVLICAIGLIEQGDSFFVFVGNQTACDTCDEHETYSKRNVMCCFGFSKCCGYVPVQRFGTS